MATKAHWTPNVKCYRHLSFQLSHSIIKNTPASVSQNIKAKSLQAHPIQRKFLYDLKIYRQKRNLSTF